MTLRTRGLALRLLASAGVAALVVLLLWRQDVRTDGPIALTDPIELSYEFSANQATTWGTTLPSSGGASPATLLAVEPQEINGLDLIGIRACVLAAPGCAVINAAGWPLTGVDTVPVEGLVLEPPEATDAAYQLIVGVRRQPSSDVGSIGAIKLTYRIDGVSYEVLEPWSLKIVAPGSLAPS